MIYAISLSNEKQINFCAIDLLIMQLIKININIQNLQILQLQKSFS